jgi:hypothetical protein
LLSPAIAFISTQLADAQKQDFFTFFHLLEAGRADGKDGTKIVTFKPLSSPKFKELATVNTTIDRDGKILAINLSLSRSFIDDRANGIFARDIAGSFISGIATAADVAALKDLINEIKFPKDTGGSLLLTGSPPPKVPAQPTDGYATYLGKRKDFELSLSASTLRMENRNEGGSDVLSIAASPK